MNLPRYGLLDYLHHDLKTNPSEDEEIIIKNLTRAGKRLKGFTRTNLFKQLESGGRSFLLSIYRHIMRNALFIHALKEGLPIPIGQQESSLLDDFITDENDIEQDGKSEITFDSDIARYQDDAAILYQQLYDEQFKNSTG